MMKRNNVCIGLTKKRKNIYNILWNIFLSAVANLALYYNYNVKDHRWRCEGFKQKHSGFYMFTAGLYREQMCVTVSALIFPCIKSLC